MLVLGKLSRLTLYTVKNYILFLLVSKLDRHVWLQLRDLEDQGSMHQLMMEELCHPEGSHSSTHLYVSQWCTYQEQGAQSPLLLFSFFIRWTRKWRDVPLETHFCIMRRTDYLFQCLIQLPSCQVAATVFRLSSKYQEYKVSEFATSRMNCTYDYWVSSIKRTLSYYDWKPLIQIQLCQWCSCRRTFHHVFNDNLLLLFVLASEDLCFHKR